MNRNEIPSYWWDLYSVCVDCYCKRRIKNYWNALATALPLLTGNYTPRYFIGCVTCWLFSLICGWWVSIQHIVVIIWRWKFFLKPSVLIPIDCPVVGPEPSMLNLLALSKKKCRMAKGVQLSSVLFWKAFIKFDCFVSQSITTREFNFVWLPNLIQWFLSSTMFDNFNKVWLIW